MACATALSRAASSDWAWVAWIVPIWEASAISGYAVFLCEPDPDHYPDSLVCTKALQRRKKRSH